MKGNKVAGKVLISVLMIAALLGLVSQVQARGGWEGGDRDHQDRDHDSDHHKLDYFYTSHYFPYGHEVRDLPRGFMRIILGGLEYFYFEGSFYRTMADRYAIVPAPVGAVVMAIPTGCQPVNIDGITYYLINGNTYMHTSVGYQVVPQPKVVVAKSSSIEVKTPMAVNVQPQVAPVASVAADNTFTVNIPNSKGRYTPVTLTRSGNGFIGPQGEYYTEFPRIEQLKVMYGK